MKKSALFVLLGCLASCLVTLSFGNIIPARTDNPSAPSEKKPEPQKKKTICLNMIVKDESPVIERCLSSVKWMIDYWVIVDTGSTDGTQEIIKKALQDIPGELHERPWVNFGHNRQEALEFAKDKGDYLLFIDADEQLIFPNNIFLMPSFDKDFYLVSVDTGYALSNRLLFANNHLDWKWEGVVHETLSCSQETEYDILATVTISAKAPDGHRSLDPQKYYKDALVLEKALEEDPLNRRNLFFLARSYAGAMEFALALKNFEKRSKLAGNEEEVYCSLYMIGEMQEYLNMPHETIVASYTRAYEYRPSRYEAIFGLARAFNKHGDYALAYLLTTAGLSTPPSEDSINILYWLQDYGFSCLRADCAFKMGRYEEARNLIEQLLVKKNTPQPVEDELRQNLAAVNNRLQMGLGNLPKTTFTYAYPHPTFVAKCIVPIEVSNSPSGLENVDCIYVINLDARKERWERIQKFFGAQGLRPNRVAAINGWELPPWKKAGLTGPYITQMTGGEMGCLLSHLSVYKDAYERGFNTVWICEDDVSFLEGADRITSLVEELSQIDPDWDVLYTDHSLFGHGDQHPRPNQPEYTAEYQPVSENLVKIHSRRTTHSILYSRKGLKKALDYFTHLYLWTPIDIDIHYVPGLREYCPKKNIVVACNSDPSDTQIGSEYNQK